MKKISISALLLAMSFAPAAHAVDFEPTEGMKFSVYGGFEPSFKSTTDANGDSQFEYSDEGSILGLYGEHQINEMITVLARAEFEFFTDDTNPSFNFDEGWFGAKGPWGKVMAGGQESPYTYLIKDNVNIFEIAEPSGGLIPEENNMIVYRSPNWNGFSFSSKARIVGEGDGLAGANQDGTKVAFGGVAGYSGDFFSIRAGGTTLDGGADGGPDPADGEVDGATYGVTGDVTFGPATLAAKYEETNGDDVTDTSFAAVTGSYSYGPGKLYSSVQLVDPDGSSDRTEFTVGADYKPMGGLKLYTEAGFFDRNNDQGDVIAVGAIYEF